MNGEAFRAEVYDIVRQIPQGQVLSYGDVARLAGFPNHSRLVGRVMSETPADADVPCHRVVNSQGHMSPVFPEQRERLAAEGVRFTPQGNVIMKEYKWTFNELAKQRAQRPNLFGLCRVATQEDEVNLRSSECRSQICLDYAES